MELLHLGLDANLVKYHHSSYGAAEGIRILSV